MHNEQIVYHRNLTKPFKWTMHVTNFREGQVANTAYISWLYCCQEFMTKENVKEFSWIFCFVVNSSYVYYSEAWELNNSVSNEYRLVLSRCIGNKYGIAGVVPYFITLKLILPLVHAYSNQTEHITYSNIKSLQYTRKGLHI